MRNPEEPPSRIPLPKPKWLLTAYFKDVLCRLDEVKSQITPTFGKVLNIDSTKKVRYFFVIINRVLLCLENPVV